MGIGPMRIRVLAFGRTADRKDPWRIKLMIECIGLTGIDHEQDLPVAALKAHLLKGISKILALDIAGILELDELIPAMTSQVDQQVGVGIGLQPLGDRRQDRKSVVRER